MKSRVWMASSAVLLAVAFCWAEEAAVPAKAESSLTVEARIGTGIENREPTGVAESFPLSTETLIGWTRITGAEEPTQIQHVWKLNDQQIVAVPLAVKSSPFRTFSRVTVSGRPGKWLLEVQDMDGKVYGSKEVTVAAN